MVPFSATKEPFSFVPREAHHQSLIGGCEGQVPKPNRHITSLHRHKLLVSLKVIIGREHLGTDQLLLQDGHEVQQILGSRITDVIYLVWRHRQTIFTYLLLRSMLHHTYHTLHNVIYKGKVTLAVAIVEDLIDERLIRKACPCFKVPDDL